MVPGSGGSNEAVVTAVGVAHASTGASHDWLRRSAANSCQSGSEPLGVEAERSEMSRISRPWSSEDEARLRALAAAGRSAATIAERLKRPPNAVRYKAKRLNILLRRAKLTRARKKEIGE
jgi:hypothetical protein